MDRANLEIQNLKDEQKYSLIFHLYMKANPNQVQRQRRQLRIQYLQITLRKRNHKGDHEEYKVQLILKWLVQEEYKFQTIAVEYKQLKIPMIYKQQVLTDLMIQVMTMKQIWEVCYMILILKPLKCTSSWKNKEWKKRIIYRHHKISIQIYKELQIQLKDNREGIKWEHSISIQM